MRAVGVQGVTWGGHRWKARVVFVSAGEGSSVWAIAYRTADVVRAFCLFGVFVSDDNATGGHTELSHNIYLLSIII